MNVTDCKLGMLVDSTYHKVEGATIIAIDKPTVQMDIVLGYHKGFNTPAGGGIDAHSYDVILQFTKNIISKNEFDKFNLYGWAFSKHLNVVSNIVIVDKKENGCICFSCKEFYPYAQPNQTNGTLKCYSCRTY